MTHKLYKTINKSNVGKVKVLIVKNTILGWV